MSIFSETVCDKGPLFWEIVAQIILKAIQRQCSMKMKLGCWGREFMVFNAPFNNISVTSWRSVLLVGETGEPGENHRPVASHWQTLSRNVVSSTLKEELFIVNVILVVRLKFVLSNLCLKWLRNCRRINRKWKS
jgi:hypothetical protein